MRTLFLLFLFFSVLFPLALANKLIFVIIIVIYLLDSGNSISIRRILAPLVILFIFLNGLNLAMVNFDFDQELAQQFLFSVFELFLIFPILKYNINLNNLFIKIGVALACYTLLLLLLLIFFPENLFSRTLLNLFYNYSSGSIGVRDFTEEGFLSFHIGSVPFLQISVCITYIKMKFNIKKILLMSLQIFVIWISGSRGLIITSFVSLFLIVLINLQTIYKYVAMLFLIPTLGFIYSFLLKDNMIFSDDEFSNQVKLGHLNSFHNQLTASNLLFGNGLASYYYSQGFARRVSHTEITILDMLRYFGIIQTSILYYFIIFPHNRFFSFLRKPLTLVFIIYVINSFTNPTMFNSFGLMVVLWYWSVLLLTE